MTSIEPVAREFDIAIDELMVWVERRWVLPGRSGAEFFFSDADRARLRMIVEFRRDLAPIHARIAPDSSQRGRECFGDAAFAPGVHAPCSPPLPVISGWLPTR